MAPFSFASFRLQLQSKVIVNGQVSAVKKDSTAFIDGIKGYRQFAGTYGRVTAKAKSGKFGSIDLSKSLARDFQSLATRINLFLEEPVIKHLGATKLEAKAGGFSPDFVIQDAGGKFKASEIKNITAEASGFDMQTGFTGLGASQVRKIGLAGGSGVTISRGSQNLITGFDQDTGELETSLIDSSPFYLALSKAKNQAAIVKALEGADPSAQAYKKSLSLKASSIVIPITVGDKVILRGIEYDFKDMKRIALSGKGGKFVLSRGSNGDLKLQFEFTAGEVARAINDINTGFTREFSSGFLAKEFSEAMAKTIAGIPPERLSIIKKILKDSSFTVALEYLKGSVKIAAGTLLAKKAKDRSNTQQRFISQVQLSALVQERLARTMDRAGTPNPPDLKYRSGRFASTVRAIPNYRKSIITYFLNPIYTSLESYGYNPGRQVEVATREVVQSLFKQRFKILRGN